MALPRTPDVANVVAELDVPEASPSTTARSDVAAVVSPVSPSTTTAPRNVATVVSPTTFSQQSLDARTDVAVPTEVWRNNGWRNNGGGTTVEDQRGRNNGGGCYR